MGKAKKLLTLEQLTKFCQQNKFYNFSSEDTGYTLSVQVPGKLNFSKKKSNTLLYADVKVCHTLLNRNGSFISEENMIKAMPTLKNQPLLASIIEIDDEGTLDFNSHDMEIIENEDGTATVEYIEKQIGSFDATEDPYLLYDKDEDKTYVIATAAIPREYTPAASIIERKNGTKVSCELIINKMSYNAKEKYLELEDFEFSGVCCLGEHVAEGMKGSRLDIKDFATENNSVRFEQDDKLIETLEKLNETLSNFNINTNDSMKGGNNQVFEKLLEQYGKAVEDITFEYEGLSDEELEVAFAEAFDEIKKKKVEDDDTSVVTEETPEVESEAPVETKSEDSEPVVVDEEDSVEEENSEEEVSVNSLQYSIVMGELKKEFSLSLADKQFAVYTLVNDTYAEQDNDFYDVDVYEETKEVVMHGWFSGKHFKQSYKIKNDSYSLKGDRVEVYAQYLTSDEIAKLDSMKANYSEISEKLAKYEAEPEKMQILESADYSSIADKDEFTELKKQENHFDLTVDELKAKADEIILLYAKKGALNFSSNEEEKHSVGMRLLPTNKKNSKRSRYGGLGKKED